MGKSSSSLKKKRYKKVSQSLSRKKTKSKSGRNKSKKLRRRDDSVSCSDYSGSTSSLSASSSSSEDDYRKRRSPSRTRTRRDIKRSKKRARGRSSSRESSEESPPAKKRKGSKRNDNYEGRKKSRQQMKRKRDASISSRSSGSLSCSTCPSGGSGSGEDDFQRNRGQSRYKERDQRKLEKTKVGSRRRARSRSCSSCSRYSESSDFQSKEMFNSENHSRRLRSVITVLRDENEEIGLDGDKHDEQMIYDHDDYPPCRSNDSIDGGSKREFAYQSNGAAENKRYTEDEREEIVISKIRSSKLVQTGDDFQGKCDGNNPSPGGVEPKEAVNESKSEGSGAADGLNADNLESILRQRALENLKRFRGGGQTIGEASGNLKNRSDSEAKPLSIGKDELPCGTQMVQMSNEPSTRKIPSNFSYNSGEILDGNDGISGPLKHVVACPPDQVALAAKSKEKVSVTTSSVSDRSKLVSSALKPVLLNTSTTRKQVSTLHKSPEGESVTMSAVDEIAVGTAQTTTGSTSGEVKNALGSTSNEPSDLNSKSGDAAIDKTKVENKEVSQYEQKKMSVMRGGEMVQVSYKVYIPKKAPALARRPIRR